MVKKSPKVPKVKKDLANQSLEDFLDNWDEDDSNDEPAVRIKKKEDPGRKKKEKAKTAPVAAPITSEVKAQTKYIQTLKEKDPDFYEFLKENDEELLNFNESDVENDDDDEEEKSDKDDDDEEEVGAHQLPEKLEVASDESDYEEDEEELEEGQQKSAGGMIKRFIFLRNVFCCFDGQNNWGVRST